MLRSFGYSEVTAALDFPSLIESLRRVFRGGGGDTPAIQHFNLPAPGGQIAELSVAPAWQVGDRLGVRIETRFPGNPAKGEPAVIGSYLLMDGATGKPLALFDGAALTARRAAAASALAASYLARPDCERLLMIGTGALASHLIEAHCSVRPIRNVLVWGRDPGKAQRLAQRLTRRELKVGATDDLQRAVNGAHVICCATSAQQPLLQGHWLPLGVHVDLVGGVTPAMREADDEAVRRARIFVDARDAAIAQAGDIAQPIAAGILYPDDIAGDLFELARGSRAGRRFHDQITLFKSVGHPLEDLAAARQALENAESS
jgi:ornithine cyclodeaminase